MARIMDCTLRDGANVLGKGFSGEITTMVVEGLIKNNIRCIEYGNCLGVGAYEANGSIAPLTDVEYLDLLAPYMDRAEIGMFMGRANANADNVALCAAKGLSFLRIGANAGDGEYTHSGIRLVKEAGMTCRYSIMKAYLLPPAELAKEAVDLEKAGLDEITVMDSAGYMTPAEAAEYVVALTRALSIPVAFHGHNNLGLSAANGLAALDAGAEVLDCGLMGMARSAGNLPTEIAAALIQKRGCLGDVDFIGLLHFIDEALLPEMQLHGYHCAIKPLDLIYGYTGCHSSFAGRFQSVADRTGVDLYRLIAAVSEVDRKAPSEELIMEKAAELLLMEDA